MSGTERRVWYRLRGKRLGGFKFRRQLPIGPYFADFACLSARLVIEIDGGEHHEESRDVRRTAYLVSQGFRVIRVPASHTDQHLDDVIECICCALEQSERPHPAAFGRRPPRRAGGEGQSEWPHPAAFSRRPPRRAGR
jgi:very-short-patch-repair endonuclease